MNRVWSIATGLLFSLVVATASFSQETTATAEQRAASTKLLEATLELGGEEVSVDDVEVQAWTRTPIQASRIVRVGGQYLVQIEETGQVFGGRSEEPGRVRVNPWRSAESVVAELALPPLPQAPGGFEVRSLMLSTQQGIRVTGDPTGRWLYVLGIYGTVDRYDTQTGEKIVWLEAADYLRDTSTLAIVQGLCFDDERRMYLCVNQADHTLNPVINRVTIYRSAPVEHGDDTKPALEPWLETQYVWGGHHYNHGVANIAQGPDGMMYVGSGSRTDANEDFDEPNIADGGEVEITACMWRLDPDEEQPTLNLHARGLRNAYGFDWDAQGRLWATENGPNLNPPGELNVVEAGKHYGFPYRFSDWPRNPYPHVGDPPAGLTFELPVINVGPDAGGGAEKPLSTFDAHSSPNGLAYLDEAFGPELDGALAVVRFGNQLGRRTVGYDLLLVRPLDELADDGRRQVTVTRWMDGLARPLDVYAAPTGRLYILEHAREVAGRGSRAAASATGRLLELRPLP
ncbi:MAG: PQQ-dependent sugar dehydrogenase [Planctomycetota bacterium]